jgi:hypothetical protein
MVAIAIVLALGSIVFIRSISNKSSKSLKSSKPTPQPTNPSSASGYGGHQHTNPEPVGFMQDRRP